MASPLDIQEQEQIDALKAFWNRYGNLVTWLLALALAGVAAFNGWNWWQRRQAENAAVLYDQLVKASEANDVARSTTIFNDIRSQYPRTAYAASAGLLAAKVQVAQSKPDDALQSLQWVGDQARDADVKVLARMAAAGVFVDKQQFDEALKQLDAAGKPEGSLGAMVADRRGDVLKLQGKTAEAQAAYELAYRQMDPKLEYRQLIDAKLAAMGVAAPVVKPTTPAAAAASGASK